MEQRAVIKFNAKLGRSASETYILMKQVYGTLCLSKSNVFIWHKRFSEGRNTLEDDKHTGRPSSSKTPESIEKVREFVANNRSASLRMMAEVLHINKEMIRTILHEDLECTQKKSRKRFGSKASHMRNIGYKREGGRGEERKYNLRRIIYILLLISGIEQNPGPKYTKQTTLDSSPDKNIRELIVALSDKMEDWHGKQETKLSSVEQGIEKLDRRIQQLETMMDNTAKSVSMNSEKIREMDTRIEFLEIKMRENNLFFHGVEGNEDLKKAFDTVPRALLWAKLVKIGLNHRFVNLIKCYYEDMTAAVRWNNSITEFIEIRSGVLQAISSLRHTHDVALDLDGQVLGKFSASSSDMVVVTGPVLG
ncbi:hypothetical protein LAZ67_3001032 [Cordylochernes scorpioides]|uniref:Mos1 transposase HTH domain-containing protein n=1 Tax=Cordylochernes scorpioides TaxID=51811 RepID=A0ABY6K7E7_9ARAC|nr:hypothetical protein LAZ67_3001032 [Cordylochernes scorpioides]